MSSRLSKIFDKNKNNRNAPVTLEKFKESTPVNIIEKNEIVEYKLSSFFEETKEEWVIQGHEQTNLNDSPLIPKFKIGTVDSSQIAAKEEVKAKTWGASKSADDDTTTTTTPKKKRNDQDDRNLISSLNSKIIKTPGTEITTAPPELKNVSGSSEKTKLKEVIDSLNKEIVQLKSEMNSITIEKTFNVNEHIDLSTYKRKNEIIPNQQKFREKYETKRKIAINTCS